MTRREYAAKIMQLSALQTQMAALALELDVPREAWLTEAGKCYDEIQATLAVASIMISEATGDLPPKVKC